MAKKEVNIEALWRYAEGSSTKAERENVEQAIENDPIWQGEWASIRSMHTQLTELVPDQPSMRFAKNVLESLPPAARRLENISFLPKWAKIAWSSLFGLLVLAGCYLLVFPIAGMARPDWLEKILPEAQLPTLNWQFSLDNAGLVAAIFLSVLLILALDHLLQSRRTKGSLSRK